jgi:predicted ATPase
VLLFYTWARHYAQVIDRAEAHLPLQPGGGLIKDIMVTLDSGFVDDALLHRADTGTAGWSTAEVLRARADALLAEDCPLKAEAAEAVLIRALNVAKHQGALAWELRSATSLAQLWQRQGRHQQAHELLAPIYNRFTEGFATPDLSKVRRLLDELQGHLHA